MKKKRKQKIVSEKYLLPSQIQNVVLKNRETRWSCKNGALSQ